MTLWRTFILALSLAASAGALAPAASALEPDQLRTAPGVYGTFAAYRISADWSKLELPTRIADLTAFRAVVEQHRGKLAVDAYLLRGLSEHADILLRVHAAELKDTQQFLLDLQNSPFGKHLATVVLFHGLTKKANYVPGFTEQLKTDLKAPSESGPYAIVIPIRKDADWWSLPQDKRAGMMQEHTEAALPYHKTVKRKLYHSTGLDDFDFITYFETARLDDFQNLILSLQKVKEARHNRRFGNPTFVGTAKSLDQLIETLAQ